MALAKTLSAAKKASMNARKLAKPTVRRGKTAWPKTTKDAEKYGVRLDYDGIVKRNGVPFHKFQLQPNAGKIPTSIANWMKKNGSSTHAVMAVVLVKEGATESEVEQALDTAFGELEI